MSDDDENEFQDSSRWRGEPRPGHMKLVRQRDNQQWIYDYIIKTTGRDRHFFYDGRKLPGGTRSYAMTPRQMARAGRHKEGLARAAEERGHRETALKLYHKAALDYHVGQQALPYDNDAEKLWLYGKLLECFDKVIELHPRKIEQFEVDWNGVQLAGLFYPALKQPAPTILHVSGTDSPKELFPDALGNPYTARGINVAIVDGPGQGLSNIRQVRITPENHAPAMKAAVDYLLSRPDVDPETFACVGFSVGAFFAMKLAAIDPRIKALAGTGAYGSPYSVWNQEVPHYKRQFMYMSGITDEAKFDRIAERYVLTNEEIRRVSCPVLMFKGEFDSANPLEEAWRVYENLQVPKEFWVTENDGHTPGTMGHLGGLQAFDVMVDWVRDALKGIVPPAEGRLKLIKENSGKGQYGDPVAGFWLPERLEGA